MELSSGKSREKKNLERRDFAEAGTGSGGEVKLA